MFKRSLSWIALGVFLAMAACSTAPKNNAPDTNPAIVSNDSRSTAPTTDTNVSAKPTATPVRSSSVEEFKNSGREIFDTDQIHFNLEPTVWKKIADAEGIQTYEKVNSNDSIVAFRGEAIIQAYLPKIATVLNTPDLRKEWIDGLVESTTIEKYSDFDRVEYNHTKVPWPLQDRDFVYRAKVSVNKAPPTMLITMQSVAHSNAPEKDGIVRGNIIYSYYYMKQIPGVRATKLVLEVAVDPKGAIPKWLVNLSQKRWPFNTLLALKKVSQREDLVVSKEIEDYFKEKKKKK